MNPPPPPPHGEVPKGSGLPPGKYDIFIIPPHSAGSGFLYLPSLQPSVNSFAAGFATALILVAVGQVLTPVIQAWWQGVKGSGGMGIIMIMVAIAVGAWALGRTQIDGGPGPGGGGSAGPTPPPNTHGASAGAGGNPGFGGAAPNGHAGGTGPAPGTSSHMPGGGMPGGERPKPSWQRTNAGAGAAGSHTANGSWERAREETRKREEERKVREAERKRKEENERKLKEAREKEARERDAREKAQREAREAREKIEREVREKIERETKERLEKEREREREREKERENETKVKSSTYAFSAVGEKTNPWPRGAPPAAGIRSQSSSPTKKPPPPTAKTYLGTEDDGFSYRPYDKARKPTHKKSQSSIYSESSYAASHTTAQTTPPPSRRGPYSTKDPDKIVIKAVYSFTNAFLKTPTSQLVSGVGSVTDGLILRITTEGLFIDDDVRGVPQREWDVKAWTLKLVEVWCPTFRQGPAGNSTSASASARPANPVRRLWNLEKDKAAVNEEADALLVEMLQACKDTCRFSPAASAASLDGAFAATGSPIKSSNRYGARQTGENKSAGLHVLRASIRDQEGKRYVFIITEEESWKVAIGLQRLRKGTQVRALGVSSMSTGDARTTLENLGWG